MLTCRVINQGNRRHRLHARPGGSQSCPGQRIRRRRLPIPEPWHATNGINSPLCIDICNTVFFPRLARAVAGACKELKAKPPVSDGITCLLGYHPPPTIDFEYPDENKVLDCPKNLAHLITMELRMRRSDRQWRWMQLSSRPRRASDGRVLWDGVATDITARKQAEAASQAAEQRLANIIEFLPDATFVIDQDKRAVAWNRACEIMTGVKKDAVLGLGDYAYAEPFYGERRPILVDLLDVPAPELEAEYRHVVRKGDMVYMESFVPGLNGGLGAYLWDAAAPLFDQTGQRCGAIEVIRDVTAQKHTEQALRESEIKHRTVFETASDAILLMHGDQFIDCNARALTMFGCTREQIVGAPPYDFSPPTQPDGRRSDEKAMEKIRLAQTEGPQFFEWVHCQRNGTPFTAEVSLNRLELGGEALLQAIVRDITERKRIEEMLWELNATLEQRVAERTAELATAKDCAESADRMKSAFLATMSHELRTPLNSIIGFTGILLQELAGPLNEEQTKQLRMVQASSRHLLALINDVLDISKIEAGQLAVERAAFDLRTSIEKVVCAVTPAAEQRGLYLRLDIAAEVGTVVSDRRRVEQVLMNLLGNAVKFTGTGGITVSCAIADAVTVTSVRDTGIGISVENIPRLFRPFEQIDTGLSRQHEGTGLGLSICKRLLGLMGGTISVESEPGAGSVFTFRLPMEPDEADHEPIDHPHH